MPIKIVRLRPILVASKPDGMKVTTAAAVQATSCWQSHRPPFPERLERT